MFADNSFLTSSMPSDVWLTGDCFKVLTLLIAIFLAYLFIRVLILRIVQKLIARRSPAWEEALDKHHVYTRTTLFLVGLLGYLLLPLLFPENAREVTSLNRIFQIYLVICLSTIATGIASAFRDLYRQVETERNIPLTSIIQAVKLGIWCLAGFLIFATVFRIDVTTMIAIIGATTAVISFVFRDLILGFTASLQLAWNDMVAIGDWIEMPEYGADGHVQEINLTSVKVRNWDQTVTTVPIYSMVSHAFRNWRGLEESGGRRIRQAINIDIRSIQLCDPSMLERFSKFPFIAEYIEFKREEAKEIRDRMEGDGADLKSDNLLTNIGVFRAFIQGYLRSHPKINRDMMLFVRLLEATDHGLPIEITAFTTAKDYQEYELVQSDIFDDLYAIVPEFDLRVFQVRSDLDIRELRARGQFDDRLETVDLGTS